MYLITHPNRSALSKVLKSVGIRGAVEQHSMAYWECSVELPSDEKQLEAAIRAFRSGGCEVLMQKPRRNAKRNSRPAEQPPGNAKESSPPPELPPIKPPPQQYAMARLTLETRERLRLVQRKLQSTQNGKAAEHGLKPAQISLSDAALAAATDWLRRGQPQG